MTTLKTLTIIIPVYNEKDTIEHVVEKIVELRLPLRKEIIIVDDGSTDGTADILRQLLKHHKSASVQTVFSKVNQGKGAAVIEGIRHASGDYLLIQDADFEYDPEQITSLVGPILKASERIAVYGSRFKNNDAVIPLMYLWGNKLLTMLTNIVYLTRLTDMETGYKLLPLTFCKSNTFRSEHFGIEVEITAKLVKNHIPIIEIPIRYKGRSKMAGKKLTVMDAWDAIRSIFYYRFNN